MNKGKERSCERITSDCATAHEAASRVHLKNELFHGEINEWTTLILTNLSDVILQKALAQYL
jgi:hypothetical protein